MKRLISFAVSAVLVASLAAMFGGCGLFGSKEAEASTTERETAFSETEPAVTTEFPFTETVTEEPTTLTTTTKTTTTTAAPKPSTTATTKQSGTTASTTTTTTKAATTTTTEPTTAFKANPSSTLSNHVIAPLNSGNYTMSVVITEDEEDQITKYVSDGKTAYAFQIPSAGYYCRLISLDGKYYMIAKTNTKSIYCELSSDDYNNLKTLMNNCFNYNFTNLSFQSSSVELYDSKLYTKEIYLRPDGQNTYLWFKSDSLKYVEEHAGTSSAAKVGVTVASGADSSMFAIPDGYTLTAYKDMASIQMAIEMFLSDT